MIGQGKVFYGSQGDQTKNRVPLMPPTALTLDLHRMNRLDPRDYWMTTYTGRKLHYLAPHSDEIDLRDIVRGVSRESRFAGQTEHSYYVAEHLIHCANLVEPKYQALALVHDAPEAYLRDLPRPFKKLLNDLRCPIEEIERRILNAILLKFGIPYDQRGWAQVIEADNALLIHEARAMVPGHREWEFFRSGGVMPLVNPPDLHFWTEVACREKYERQFQIALDAV